ncbi:penicillin-binding protein 1A [Sessilibacter corallicola]|uniref:Penicillin-binding protein 1A n=1 Tax=Sessilibacter corallicola TaxID=2904075 RepID=A0ABQ0A5E3_9GAMM
MSRTKIVISVTFWLTLFFAGSSAVFLAGIYLYLTPKLPDVETLKETKFQIPLRIYTRDEKLIGEFGEKRRSPVSFDEIPENYTHAILSAEDDRFYSHGGVDIKGLLRAASQILQTGEIQGGGSTITMQVARNFFLTREQVFTRKFNEILLALQIERELTKEEILTLYVNKIYLGNRAYGIQAAAQVYYGKNIDELSLAQIAMIAGLPKAPSAFNPIVNPKRALIRRNWILGRMLELKYISQPEYDLALAEPVTAKNHGAVVDLYAPYVAEMARKEIINRFGLSAYTDGYRAYLSVDSTLQASAQTAVVNGLEEYDKRHGYRGPEATLETTAVTEQALPKFIVAIDEPAVGELELNDDKTLVSDQTQILNSQTPIGDLTDLAENVKTDIEEELFDTLVADYNKEQWLEFLKNIPTYAGRIPGAVTRVSDAGIHVLLDSDDEIFVPVENGLEKIRTYLSENSRTAPHKSPRDFINPGDVVRVFETENDWHFGQIPEAQGALVALDPKDGGIRALVGGYDFNQSHFNRAVQATRQPGSNFKPFIYTTALENGFTPATIVNDAPIVFDDASLESTWRPENSSGKFYGPTRLRVALYNSRNLVSIRVLQSMGINTTIENLERFGFEGDNLPRDLSLALGSHALTPMQIATGYSSFANGGYKVSPYLIDKIEDSDENSIYLSRPETVCDDICQREKEIAELTALAEQELEIINEASLGFEAFETETMNLEDDVYESELEPTPQAKRIMSKQVNFLINSMLRDVVKRGTGRKALTLKRDDLAGKTGTTNGPTDAWFSGYNSQLVATTWVGFDQNQLLGVREFGGSAALPIWIEFMETALNGVPEDNVRQPNGIVSVKINPETGGRARQDDPDAIFEVFRAENAPQPIIGNQDDKVADSIEELF